MTLKLGSEDMPQFENHASEIEHALQQADGDLRLVDHAGEQCEGCDDRFCEDCHPECPKCEGKGFYGYAMHCDDCGGMGSLGWSQSDIDNEMERRGMDAERRASQ